MSSFEWMELQTLTADIAASRSRLATARSGKDHRLARVLEQEIGAAEERRTRLLAHITSHVAGGAAPDLGPGAGPPPATAPVDPPAPPRPVDNGAGEYANPSGAAASAFAPPPAATEAKRSEGGVIVWDQLTPNDIERAKDELGVRRAEMLARHAEELKAIEADQNQLDTLVEAIDAFTRKFKLSSPSEAEPAAVVALDEERGMRLLGRA